METFQNLIEHGKSASIVLTNLPFSMPAENPIILADLDQIVSTFSPWDFFRSQSVFVTGGAGLLGSYLVRTLLRANDCLGLNIRVTCLLRNRPALTSRLNPWLNHPGLNLVFGSAEDYDYPSLMPHSIVVHAASQASPSVYNKDPVGTILPNSIGTVRLCEQAQRWQAKKLLFFSSAEIYGANSKADIGELESGYLDPMAVRSCYAESKRIGETICKAYTHQYSLNATCVRIFHTYGPQIALDDGRVFADFVRDALQGDSIFLASAGTAMRCFCYLTDATSGFLRLLVDGAPGESYNLANPDAEITILDLAHLISGLSKTKPKVEFVDPGHAKPDCMSSPVPRSLPSIAKIRGLGWKPLIGLEEGFGRTLESYSFLD
jgi:UDP-glucuronate decarboxylase